MESWDSVAQFKIKDQLRECNVAVFSSNYTLYDDMSRRLQEVLRPYGQEMEIYSIDENTLQTRSGNAAMIHFFSAGPASGA